MQLQSHISNQNEIPNPLLITSLCYQKGNHENSEMPSLPVNKTIKESLQHPTKYHKKLINQRQIASEILSTKYNLHHIWFHLLAVQCLRFVFWGANFTTS